MLRKSRSLISSACLASGLLFGLPGASSANDSTPAPTCPTTSGYQDACSSEVGEVFYDSCLSELFCDPCQNESLYEQTKLTNYWWGLRPGLAEEGVTLDINTTQYYQGVASGGLQQDFRYGARNDYFVNIDGEKIGLWKGLFVTLHGESRYGQSINPLTGTMMPPNLALVLPKPGSEPVTALTGVKVMQFLSEDFMVFGGKINTFDDFKQPLTGAGTTNGFMNTSLMLNPVLIRTVPYSSFGAGFAVLEDMKPTLSFAVFDTNDTPTTSGFDSFFDNGVTMVAQANMYTNFFEMPGRQGMIGTYSTGSYTNLSPSIYYQPGTGVVIQSTPKQGSWCLGYTGEQALYVSPVDPRKYWGVFGTLGIADDNPSPVHWTASAGLAGSSPFSGRQNDTFGAGYFYTGTSDALTNLAPVLLPLGDEQGVELYYNIAVTPWCHITPDLQVLNPFRQRVDSSLLVGMRAKIDF
jgi:porin